MHTFSPSRLRRLVRLAYPVQVVCQAGGVWALFPDLPELRVAAQNVRELYARLEPARRAHLAELLGRGAVVPLPNSHLDGASA